MERCAKLVTYRNGERDERGQKVDLVLPCNEPLRADGLCEACDEDTIRDARAAIAKTESK